jgi:hypothetical protein
LGWEVRVKRFLISVSLSVGMALTGGCANKITQGKVVTTAHLAGLMPGVTSYDEASKLLGEPDSLMKQGDKLIATWRRGEIETYGVNIPGTSTLVGADNSDGKFIKVALIFDAKSKLYRTYSIKEDRMVLTQ